MRPAWTGSLPARRGNVPSLEAEDARDSSTLVGMTGRRRRDDESRRGAFMSTAKENARSIGRYFFGDGEAAALAAGDAAAFAAGEPAGAAAADPGAAAASPPSLIPSSSTSNISVEFGPIS